MAQPWHVDLLFKRAQFTRSHPMPRTNQQSRSATLPKHTIYIQPLRCFSYQSWHKTAYLTLHLHQTKDSEPRRHNWCYCLASKAVTASISGAFLRYLHVASQEIGAAELPCTAAVQSPICETPLLCAEAECGLAGEPGDVQGLNKGRAPLLNHQSLSIRLPHPFGGSRPAESGCLGDGMRLCLPLDFVGWIPTCMT